MAKAWLVGKMRLHWHKADWFLIQLMATDGRVKTLGFMPNGWLSFSLEKHARDHQKTIRLPAGGTLSATC